MDSLKLFFKKRKYTLMTILIVMFCSGLIFSLRNINQEKNKAEADVNSSVVLTNSLIPVNIKIPKINIDTDIEIVGLTSSGTVGSPTLPANVAWFDQSPIPGGIGNSVIDGHSGWKDNIPAVFDNLYKIKIGDKIYIKNGDGDVTTFIVKELKSYLRDEIVPDIFTSKDNKAHLNLITCSGVWDELEASHSSRLVVFTDKE